MGFVMCVGVYVWVLLFVGVCRYGFCNVWVCVCMGFVSVSVCMYGFCYLWMCVCMGFVMYVCVYEWVF